MRTAFNRMAAMTAEQRSTLTDQFDKASRIATAEPVAVVGIGCRLPGGVSGPGSYWSLLAAGTDTIAEVPADRWDADAYYDPDPLSVGRMASKWGGFLSDVAGFDAEFFGITPREAEAMDPQQRLLLEVAFEALENAGIAPDDLAGVRAGVLAGVYYNEYQNSAAADPDRIDAYSATGNAHSITVGRIAYLLGLRGPAVAVDTACSSSLVAIHLACQSLRLRETDLALAGGVNLILRPETQLALSKWGMLSPRGRCHAFDAGADGFVRGEGAGVVVLKRLTDAIRDGDRVLAVVRGTAVNQDGRSNGLTAPNAGAQSDVLTRALRNADMTASTVNLIETHGTGTGLGDPIEFDALAEVYGRGDAKCALGAVKTNMGHLEAAAGIAGFIKAVLAVERGQIPPNLHFAQWNPAIDPAGTRLFVPTALTPWPDCGGPRRAGVSSFGLGGTNAHVLLEQGPEPAAPASVGDPAVSTLLVAGRSDQRVAAWAATLADWLAGLPDGDRDGAAVPLADVAAAVNRRHGRHDRLATVSARDRAQAVAGLTALAAGQPLPGVVPAQDRARGAGTVFVYSGQGAQWAGMGRRLLVDEPAFAAAIDELEPVFVEKVGFSLRDVLQTGEPVAGIDRIQPVLVGMQLALTALWRAHGVQPDAVIGHSMGEVTAAVVAGALSVADGLTVIATRSRLMSRLSGRGAMALLELGADAAAEAISGQPEVTVAVHAAPGQTVIAGPPDQVDAVVAAVGATGLLARRVEVDVASHHPTVDPILPELRAALAGLSPTTPTIPLISTVGGAEGDHTPRFDADYWVANLRNPVRFSQAVTAAADHTTFIEVSPHPLLTHAISDILGAAEAGRVIGTLTRDADETLTFHTQLATIRPPLGEPTGTGRPVDLPPTPWLHTRYWADDRAGGRVPSKTHPLLGVHVELPSGDHVWQADIGTDTLGWLADHKVHGQPVLPAAAFAEIVLAAGGQACGRPVDAVQVNRLEVEQMLPLDGETVVTTESHREADTVRIEVHARAAGGEWHRHAIGHVGAAPVSAAPSRHTGPAATGSSLSPAELYAALRRTGAQHGTAFAALTRIVRVPGSFAEAEIILPDEAAPHRAYRAHPAMLDAALQTLAAAMPVESLADSAENTYLPVSVQTIRLFGPVGRTARCRAELDEVNDDGAVGRLTLTDAAGTPTAELTGVFLKRIQRRTVPLPLSQKVFDTSWLPMPTDRPTSAESASVPGSWLMLAGGGDADAAALAAEVTAAFDAPTRRVVSADLDDDAALPDAFGRTAADPELPPAGVVLFVGRCDFHGSTADALRARDLVRTVSALVRVIVSGWHGTAPRLWLVTRGGLPVRDGDAGDPTAAALTGLVRVLAYENPSLHATVVDLDAEGSTGAAAAALIDELGSPSADDVVARRGAERFVERLSRAELGERRVEPVVRPDGSYLVTGGLGGLGTVVLRWLVESGARRVVLNGRSEPSAEQAAVIDDLAGRAEIAVVRGDIAAPGVAERLVAAAEETGAPLRGVIHSAAVIDDQIVTGLTADSLDRVWAPKALGAQRLHEATREATGDRRLDWWVGFSSVAALLGSPGQAAYACANAWLDGLVAWRRAAGLPATTINWGQWSEVGVARTLAMSALDPVSPAEGVEALESVLARDPARIGVVRLRLDRAAAAFPEIRRLGYFATLAGELDADISDDWAGPAALAEVGPAEATRIVTARLRRRIAAVMGYSDDSAVRSDQPLTELGLDSLMAVRMRNTIRGDFGTEPPVTLLLQGASLADLARHLIDHFGIAGDDDGDGAGNVPAGGVRARARTRAATRQRAAQRRKVG